MGRPLLGVAAATRASDTKRPGSVPVETGCLRDWHGASRDLAIRDHVSIFRPTSGVVAGRVPPDLWGRSKGDVLRPRE
jgi:hypothetical protein